MLFPSGAHTPYPYGPVTNRVGSCHSPRDPGGGWAQKAISRPSGDHLAEISSRGESVRRTGSPSRMDVGSAGSFLVQVRPEEGEEGVAAAEAAGMSQHEVDEQR